MLQKYELEGMCEETYVAYFEKLPQHSSEGPTENQETQNIL
jgi:hypothetical protein